MWLRSVLYVDVEKKKEIIKSKRCLEIFGEITSFFINIYTVEILNCFLLLFQCITSHLKWRRDLVFQQPLDNDIFLQNWYFSNKCLRNFSLFFNVWFQTTCPPDWHFPDFGIILFCGQLQVIWVKVHIVCVILLLCYTLQLHSIIMT